MIYVMSDLHGCYDEYLKALDLVHFCDHDTLYVLGDVIDRGERGLDILQHMMMHDNIIPLIGNHEWMAMSILRKLCTEITEDNAETTLTVDDLLSFDYWMHDGGKTTLDAFRKLERWQMEMILDYLDEFRLIEEVHVNDKDYVLMHAGLSKPITENNLLQLRAEDVLFQSTDIVLDSKVIVCGHTPTQDDKILFTNGQIRIDCGCVFHGNLGVLCLDDLSTFYVSKI